MHKLIVLSLLSLYLAANLQAQSRESIKKTTDVAMFLPSATGLIVSLSKHDYQGTKQLIFSGLTGIAVTYGLKYAIRKERPDHSDHHAFPSNHTSVAFQGAMFLQRRYGWKWGLPAGIVAAYVGWGRVYAKRHDWWDVIGGAAIGTAGSLLFTRPWKGKTKISLAPALLGTQYPGFQASITW